MKGDLVSWKGLVKVLKRLHLLNLKDPISKRKTFKLS